MGFSGSTTYRRCEGRDDENKMPDSAQGHHHWHKLLYVAMSQRRPEGDRTCQHEMCDEEIERIPHNSNGEACPVSP